MNIVVWLMAQIALSLCISYAILALLAKPLVDLLKSTCSNGTTWSFWWMYTKVMVVLVPVLWVLGVDLLFHTGDLESAIRRATLALLTGQVLTLYLLGKRLGQFIPTPTHK